MVDFYLLFIILVEILPNMKKLFLLIAICFYGSQMIAQSAIIQNDIDPSQDPKYIEMKKRRAEMAENFVKSGQSLYYGYDETLKTFFIGNIIHSETPRSASYSKKDYIKVLNQWLSENKQYLKPENQNSIISE